VLGKCYIVHSGHFAGHCLRLKFSILPDEFHKNLNIDRWMSGSLPPADCEEDLWFCHV
jgi:hypothetical protein